jgi:hypothetical protein
VIDDGTRPDLWQVQRGGMVLHSEGNPDICYEVGPLDQSRAVRRVGVLGTYGLDMWAPLKPNLAAGIGNFCIADENGNGYYIRMDGRVNTAGAGIGLLTAWNQVAVHQRAPAPWPNVWHTYRWEIDAELDYELTIDGIVFYKQNLAQQFPGGVTTLGDYIAIQCQLGTAARFDNIIVPDPPDHMKFPKIISRPRQFQ